MSSSMEKSEKNGMTFVDETAPVDWDSLNAKYAVSEKTEKAAVAPEMPSRALIRQHKAMHRKILKKFYNGHSPRKIAHELGYANINRGEDEVRQIISNYMKK